MAENKNAIKDISTVLRGMGEVARVTFTKKPVKTNFTPIKPGAANKPDEMPTEDVVPLRKISKNNELIVAPEYLKEMTDFFNEHAILDSYTAPCYFNNDTCDINLCVFPRIMRPVQEQPFVKDIITVTIRHSGAIIAMAEYNTADPASVSHFQNDMESLMPAYYRDNSQANTNSLKEALMAKFPGLVIPEMETEQTEPVFLDDAPVKESPHVI